MCQLGLRRCLRVNVNKVEALSIEGRYVISRAPPVLGAGITDRKHRGCDEANRSQARKRAEGRCKSMSECVVPRTRN